MTDAPKGPVGLLGTTTGRSGIAGWASALLIATLPLQSMAEDFKPNVFFGFDMILTPIALKGACGGDVSGDVAQINALISAFPDDAQNAGIADHLQVLTTTAWQQKDPALVIGGGLTDDHLNLLCKRAIALDLTWLSPQTIGRDNPMSPSRQAAWQQFWTALEYR